MQSVWSIAYALLVVGCCTLADAQLSAGFTLPDGTMVSPTTSTSTSTSAILNGGDTTTTASDIVINELSPDHPNGDWLELYNPTSVARDISGFWLTDDVDIFQLSTADAIAKRGEQAYRIPDGTIVQPRAFAEFLLIDTSAVDSTTSVTSTPSLLSVTHPSALVISQFKLKGGGEAVYLFNARGDNLVDSISYNNDANDSVFSIGRYPDGALNDFYVFEVSSLGAPNGGAKKQADVEQPSWVPEITPEQLEEQRRRDNWSSFSHEYSRTTGPDYDEVFRRDTLENMEIIFESAEYQRQWNFLQNIIGPFGMRGGIFGRPPSSSNGAAVVGGGNTGDLRPTPPQTPDGPGCMDDPLGLVAAAGSTCLELASLPCNFDVNTINSDAPPGTLVSLLCPLTCDACVNTPAATGGGGGGRRLFGDHDDDGGDGTQLELMVDDPIYVRCTLKYRGRTWRNVAFRWKGNSSLKYAWTEAMFKIPFRLHFSRFDGTKNQRFFGFDRMTFSNNFGDETAMRELLVNDIMTDVGLVSAAASPVAVAYDAGDGKGRVSLGVFTMMEDPQDVLARHRYGDIDDTGVIYKPDGLGAGFSLPFRSAIFPQKSGPKSDLADIRALLDALHAPERTTDSVAWRLRLESVFQVSVFLQWLAVVRGIQSWDQIGFQNFYHNYYLYGDVERGIPLQWLPWDNNFSLNLGTLITPPCIAFGTANCNRDQPIGVPGRGQSLYNLDLANVDGDLYPIITFLRDDPVYWQQYVEACQRLSDSLFGDEQRMTDLIEHYDSLVGDLDRQQVYPYSWRDEGQPNRHDEGVAELKSIHVELRRRLQSFLDGNGNDNADSVTVSPLVQPSFLGVGGEMVTASADLSISSRNTANIVDTGMVTEIADASDATSCRLRVSTQSYLHSMLVASLYLACLTLLIMTIAT